MRLILVPIWMSCTGWVNTESPGMLLATACTRACTTRTGSRCGRGFSAIVICPALAVALIDPAPTNEIMSAMAGSCCTSAANCACRRAMAGMEIAWLASVTATITPVSCAGRKPFGTTM